MRTTTGHHTRKLGPRRTKNTMFHMQRGLAKSGAQKTVGESTQAVTVARARKAEKVAKRCIDDGIVHDGKANGKHKNIREGELQRVRNSRNDQRIIDVIRNGWEELQLRQQFNQNRAQQGASEIMTNVIIIQVARVTAKNARQSFGKMQAVRCWSSIEPGFEDTKNPKRRH